MAQKIYLKNVCDDDNDADDNDDSAADLIRKGKMCDRPPADFWTSVRRGAPGGTLGRLSEGDVLVLTIKNLLDQHIGHLKISMQSGEKGQSDIALFEITRKTKIITL